MKRLGFPFFAFFFFAGVLACGTARKTENPPAGPTRCTTAFEVIEKNLEALGGKEKIRSVETLILKGGFGSALLPPSERVTLYLEKPDKLKKEGSFKITLCNGNRFVFNSAGEEVPLDAGTVESLKYRVGFYSNCCSLLEWEPFFSKAELLGMKKCGDTEHYVVRFPAAFCERDLVAYIDGDTFLLDRLVYTRRHPEAQFLKVVNTLREYKDHGGIQFPTRIVFDNVGWETSPLHLVLSEVEINPSLEESLFESADVEFGTIVCEGDRIQGEILGSLNGALLTNIREANLAAIGAPDLSWLNLEVGSTRMKIRILNFIQSSAAYIKPNEIYLTQYPISGFPCFQLMGWNLDVAARIPCKKGDALILTRAKEEEGNGGNGKTEETDS